MKKYNSHDDIIRQFDVLKTVRPQIFSQFPVKIPNISSPSRQLLTQIMLSLLTKCSSHTYAQTYLILVTGNKRLRVSFNMWKTYNNNKQPLQLQQAILEQTTAITTTTTMTYIHLLWMFVIVIMSQFNNHFQTNIQYEKQWTTKWQLANISHISMPHVLALAQWLARWSPSPKLLDAKPG